MIQGVNMIKEADYFILLKKYNKLKRRFVARSKQKKTVDYNDWRYPYEK